MKTLLTIFFACLYLIACSPDQPPTVDAPVDAQAAAPLAATGNSPTSAAEGHFFSLPIKIDYYRQFDLEGAKTYHIVNYECDTTGQNKAVVQAAENELRNQLIERGLKPAEVADVTFYFLVTRDDQANVEACNHAIGYRGYHCIHCDLNRLPVGYQGGTMIIQMMDNNSQRAVWRGIGTANLDQVSAAEELILVREYVKEMFAAPPWNRLAQTAARSDLPIATHYKRSFDFYALESYRIINYEKESADNVKKVVQAAHNEIRNQLMEKGLSPADKADISVYYLVTRDDDSNVNTGNQKLGYQGYHCVHCDLNRLPTGYEGGTLLIHAIDNKTKRLVWRGVGTADLQNVSPDEELALVKQYVQQMFARAPWGTMN